MKKAEPIAFVIGILLLICAIILTVLGARSYREHQSIQDQLITIPAVVSKISVLEDSDGMDSYTACVTYTYGSEIYQDRSWEGMQRGEYMVGEAVTITLNPDAPEKPYLYSGSFMGHFGGGIVFFLLGAGVTALSFYLKKKQKCA